MNTTAWIIVLIIVFSIAFFFGAVWASMNKSNAEYDEAVSHVRITPIFASECTRCGKQFSLLNTKDPDLNLCPECWEELKNNPDDEYFKKEMYK